MTEDSELRREVERALEWDPRIPERASASRYSTRPCRIGICQQR
jgi:hypothetical protein